MTDLTSMTIAEAREGLASKSFTSLELTDAHLAAIEAARALNAFVLETPEQARTMARARSGVSRMKALSARAASIAERCASVSSSAVKDLFARPSRASASVSDVNGVIY